MSGRLLDFKQYLGGAANVVNLEMFPSDQKQVTYDFGQNVTSYNFSADYQSLVIDNVTYDRTTGNPNFQEATIKGYFTNTANVSASFINETQASSGIIKLTIPADRYTGNIIPSARQNVVCTVLSFEWETDSTPPEKDRHRFLILERYDPKVGGNVGNPLTESDFVAITTT
jgi:hypothetical protein